MTTVGPMEAALEEQRAAAAPSTTEFDMTDEKFNDAVSAVLDAPDSAASPELAMPEDTIITLPGGYLDPMSEKLIKTVEVRELTGEDEEALARYRNVPQAEFMSKLVQRGVVSAEGETVDDMFLNNLLLGDRDQILLGIRLVTFGDKIKYENCVCPQCGREFSMIVEVGEIPVRTLDEPLKRTVTVELRKGGEAEFRFPNCADHLAVSEDDTLTAPQRNTALIGRCLVTYLGKSGDKIAFERETIARKLGQLDRSNALKAIADAAPGPQLREVKASCPVCTHEAPVAIDLVDIFRP